jgi:futalosine hydrolase
MNIFVVAATKEEIGGVIAHLGSATGAVDKSNAGENPSPFTFYPTPFDVLITGVGMVATAYALGKQLATKRYDLAINLGIAGSFDRSIALGDVVEVVQDTFTELGAEDGDSFINLDNLGFGNTIHQTKARLTDYVDRSLKQVHGITVNTVHGNEASIDRVQQLTNAQIESMEGAAFFYACEQAGIPALQIRSVSNYVEKRDRNAWKIGLAVKELNTFAIELLNELASR